jgi:predicted phage terminase large subunit-like protein
MTTAIARKDALREIAIRELARRHVMDFACAMLPWYKRARHLEYLAEKLEQVALYIRTGGKEGIGRLMVFMPPRYGKSQLISQIFPAWLLGTDPDYRVILTSYGANLSQKDSRAVRDLILSDRYRDIFGKNSLADEVVEISPDSKSQSHWDLAAPHRGGLLAAGVGGGITGQGANLFGIDDPIKEWADLINPEYINNLIDWYQSVAYTRLERPGGAIILTHTRWSMDDMAGRLLKMMANQDPDFDQWEIVFLPARALDEDQYPLDEESQRKEMARGIYLPVGGDQLGRKPGEALWPEGRDDEDGLRKVEKNVTLEKWWPLYQQVPGEAVGGFFMQSDFIVIDPSMRPVGVQWYRYIDLALGRTVKSDWNACLAGALVGMDLIGRDMIRVRELNHFLAVIKNWMLSPEEQGTIWGVEDVAFQVLVWQEFMKDPQLAGVAMVPVKPVGDKMTRALPAQTRARQGHVKLINGPWVQTFLDEVIRFGVSGHDDQVDTMSGVLQMISVPKSTRLTFAVAKSQPEGVSYGTAG